MTITIEKSSEGKFSVWFKPDIGGLMILAEKNTPQEAINYATQFKELFTPKINYHSHSLTKKQEAIFKENKIQKS